MAKDPEAAINHGRSLIGDLGGIAFAIADRYLTPGHQGRFK